MLVYEGSGSLSVCETVGRNYFFNFFSAVDIWVFLSAISYFTDGFMRPSNSGMKQGTDVIDIIT